MDEGLHLNIKNRYVKVEIYRALYLKDVVSVNCCQKAVRWQITLALQEADR